MNRKISSALAIGVVFYAMVFSVSRARAYTVPEKMTWWADARFGMFIHFGSYSQAGRGEWVFSNEGWTKADYQTQISAKFNPANFDANAIVTAAKGAGMKYLVITAKHHEGYAMWKTSVPSFKDATGTKLYDLYHYNGFTRDLLGELKTACDAQGIKFCLYYSILDWNHPSQTITQNGATFSAMSSFSARTAYISDMKAQLAELIAKYDPAVMWFDGDWCTDHASPTLTDWWTSADGADLYQYLIGLKPSLIVNERVKRDTGLGDFACPEQFVPAAPLSRPWETCATMNDSWGYESNKDNSYRSVSTIVQEMVQVVSRNGNYLLNIGPKGDGSVPTGATSVLSGMGAWMKIYSESIYGTTQSPYPTEPAWGYFTKKSGRLYAHVFNWPSNGQLTIPRLKNSVTRASSLSNPAANLSYTTNATDLVISLPTSAPNAIDSVIALDVTGLPEAFTGKPSNIATNGTASASAEGSTTENALQLFDSSTTTKWFTGVNGSAAWVQYQFANGWSWKVLQYQLSSANDVVGRDPKSWDLLGSNDGTSWTTLDSRRDQTFSDRFQTLTFTVATPGNYRFYRLGILANQGGSGYGIQLSEFTLQPAAADLLDSVAPVISVPADFSIPATDATGAVVTYQATAMDDVNGATIVTSSRPSGTRFPIGNTAVQCSATDFAGNTSIKSFNVNVYDPATTTSPPAIQLKNGTASIDLANSLFGKTYQLYRSYDLSVGSWTPLGTARPGGGPLSFSDPAATDHPRAFYRLQITP